MKVNKVRYVVWSSDMAYVSLLGKHGKSKFGEFVILWSRKIFFDVREVRRCSKLEQRL